MTAHQGLQVKNLRAGYGDTIVLEGVTVDLPPGGTLAAITLSKIESDSFRQV